MQEDRFKNLIDIGTDIGRVVARKQNSYGDSISKSEKIMQIIYPNGIPVSKIGDSLLTVRVIDKLCRIANEKEAFDENPWQDISGYGLLGVDKDAKHEATDKEAMEYNP